MLPYALLCGMTIEEFWNGEPRVLCSYIKRHELELDEMNYQSWLIGLYAHKAVSSAIINYFSDKNTSDMYFDKPLQQFNSDYKVTRNEIKNTKNITYREQTNYWSKLGKGSMWNG